MEERLRYITIILLALMTVILVYIVLKHLETMKAYDVQIEQITNKVEDKKLLGVW